MIRCVLFIAGAAALLAQSPRPVRPGDPAWPLVWSSYRRVAALEEDFADLKAHGVGLISMNARDSEEARKLLDLARRTGMKFHISVGDVTESEETVRSLGLQPEPAFMIGGVHQGQAIDRHLFRFEPRAHQIVVEPPVYNKGFAYTLGSGSTGPRAAGEPMAHYFLDMPDPARAEIVVPLKRFDGKQRLKIVPAKIEPVAGDSAIENDSVTPDLPRPSEIRNRKLYRLTFDLSGVKGALLDQVGVAVYWPYHGSRKYWMFGRGAVSANSPVTEQAQRRMLRNAVEPWIEANGGRFPLDVIPVIRFGDECFYTTGHVTDAAPAVNYPLWDYSAPSVAAFRKHAGAIEYPRTWGFPEIYGADAYSWWMYTLHESCARLAGAVRDEISKAAPGLLVFRNTTRSGVLDLSNDRDGSGPELLTRNLDIAHLDPYPVTARGYGSNIPRDMSYYAGLARRYNRPLVPWMQAHTYGGPDGLQDVTPEQVDRMAAEQWRQGVDAIMWLGYGNTFPKVRPDSWERAAQFHAKLAKERPPKPQARMAVLRFYRAWSLTSRVEGGYRNPGDWMLQQLLEVWAVKHGQPYDVFEMPPVTSAADRATLKKALAKYPYLVSNQPWPGAWVIGEGTDGQTVQSSSAPALQREFEEALVKRGWIQAGK